MPPPNGAYQQRRHAPEARAHRARTCVEDVPHAARLRQGRGDARAVAPASYDIAPGTSQLVIGGNSCNDSDLGLQGVYDADLAVALASPRRSSWAWWSRPSKARPFGFLNLAFYQSTSLLSYKGQVTANGYDNMTGLGTPNGQDFIAALTTLG